MKTLQVLMPFVYSWLVTTAYLLYVVVDMTRRREPKFNQTHRDVVRNVIRRVAWRNVLLGPIVAGVVVEIVWWGIAITMGIPLPF